MTAKFNRKTFIQILLCRSDGFTLKNNELILFVSWMKIAIIINSSKLSFDQTLNDLKFEVMIAPLPSGAKFSGIWSSPWGFSRLAVI